MTLGKHAPRVRQVKSYSVRTQAEEDFGDPEPNPSLLELQREITVDLKVRSKTDLKFILQVFLVGVPAPVNFLIADVYLDLWVRLRLKLDPLGNQFFETLRLSSLGDPVLMFSVQPMTSIREKERRRGHHLPDLMQVPLIREWLHFTFVTELKNALRFPNHIELLQNDLIVFLNSEGDGMFFPAAVRHSCN